jgi:hypothetical protein
MAKNTICVWYDKDAETAARFVAVRRSRVMAAVMPKGMRRMLGRPCRDWDLVRI